ncbi:MAG: lycopene cyclase [Saprospiraceae bacterium]|nr:lycopene cyclase [Saprospiraceae bacterium]
MPKKYDYIIAGAGLSGLSLAYRMRKSASHQNASLLLLDKDTKERNDRTWCFWSKKEDLFDEINYKVWPKIQFADSEINQTYNIDPYKYKMIRGIDFYKHVLSFLNTCDKTDFVSSGIENIEETASEVIITTSNETYSAPWVFKSYYDNLDFSKSNFVWQHFKGWIIKSELPVFDKDKAIFMDFRVPQDDETRFFYVLPFNENEALVEIAVFSEAIPKPSFYDPFLKEYIKEKLEINTYEIVEEELGAIPMTDYNFNKIKSNKVIHIGTSGGQVKGSSGYAFYRIQEEMDRLMGYINQNKLADYKRPINRYHFYDRIFLNAILTGKTNGAKVFGKLFKKLSPQTIFKFLDEKGSFFNDLIVFTAPPTWPFTKAFFQELFKR